MAGLTTHVLDTANGRPANGVAIRLYALSGGRRLLASVETNDDGRTDEPLLDADVLSSGDYELEFDIGDYFESLGTASTSRPFLGTVVIRCGLTAGERYHVPLLASPWSYSTYRGS